MNNVDLIKQGYQYFAESNKFDCIKSIQNKEGGTTR